jgi:transposase
MHCEFLPPHSPDFNPIELTFSMMKYNLRRNGEYAWLAMTLMSDAEIFTTLLRALYPITLEMFYGWYRYCGYV